MSTVTFSVEYTASLIQAFIQREVEHYHGDCMVRLQLRISQRRVLTPHLHLAPSRYKICQRCPQF